MNIYDIAKLAGVSIATVSRVMNGSDRVSEKTRQKVLSIIEEESYTPNIFAKGLGLHTMHTIGILVPTISDMYMSRAVSYLEEELQEFGDDCILSCSGFEQEKKAAHVQLLLSKHIDALIMIGSNYAGEGSRRDTEYIRKAALQIPVFIINGTVRGDNIYCYVSDDKRAVEEAVSSLIESGRRRVLFLTQSDTFSAAQKLEGYRRALSRHEIPFDDRLVVHVPNHVHDVLNILLNNVSEEFDSILATTDIVGVGAVKYAAARSLRIPEELSIIGYNNTLMALGCEPELSSIDNHCDTLCKTVVQHLLAVLAGSGEEPKKLTIGCELIKRGTTDF